MNTPKAILIGFALVAAGIYFSRDVGPAQAQQTQNDVTAQLVADELDLFVMFNKRSTGEIVICEYNKFKHRWKNEGVLSSGGCSGPIPVPSFDQKTK